MDKICLQTTLASSAAGQPELKNNKEAQKRYYEKNREKLIKKTSEYAKVKRALARENKKAEPVEIVEEKKPKKLKIKRKACPLITKIETGKFIFDIEW